MSDPILSIRDRARHVWLGIGSEYNSVTAASAAQDWQGILTTRWDHFGDKFNGVYRPNATRADLQSLLEAASKIL
ncbi:hypothetical protein ACNJX9_35510 [Bradyrhizobium sp. DASA03076]|uniref:hypothetical protein n=1 Tax=Bradyrhizobium sp. BLXBL-03 TaxID=3395916 RepID=UPI003F7000E0